jgi:hypothetical protein
MTLFQGLGFWASSLSGAKPGMVLVKPTSITHSGTSASLGANGQVTFSAVTSLSLNGVFTADFNAYMISLRFLISPNETTINFRLRNSGSDATGSNYTNQFLGVNNASFNSSRSTGTATSLGYSGSDCESGVTGIIYGPFLSGPTAARLVSSFTLNSAGPYIEDWAFTHSLSTSYDGATIYPSVSTRPMTGAVQIYGIRS